MANHFVRCTIEDIDTLTPDSILVRLRAHGVITFRAGQYLCFYYTLPNGDLAAQPKFFPGTYSVASSPCALPAITIAVQHSRNPRNLRHYFTTFAAPGEVVWADPTGYGAVCVSRATLACPLSWNGGNGGALLIAGGFGIPALASIADLLCEGVSGSNGNCGASAAPDVALVHSVRYEDNIPFLAHFTALAARCRTFRAVHTVTRPSGAWTGRRGRINAALLASLAAGRKLFCVFGSAAFVESIVGMLLGLGVWAGNIRTDYSPRLDPARLLPSPGSDIRGSSEEDEQRPTEVAAVPCDAHGSAATTYLQMSGMERVLGDLAARLAAEKPEKPLSHAIDALRALRAARGAAGEVRNERAADPRFWMDYWQTDAVLWHSPETSPWLVRAQGRFLGSGKGVKGTKRLRVFVPLCGKSVDMRFLLALGHEVVGADCSGIACADFFKEHAIPGYDRVVVRAAGGAGGRIVLHCSKEFPIRLYEADVFDLTPELIGKVDRVLDRAAMVALHPDCVIPRYLPLLLQLLEEDGAMLIASVSKLPEPVAPPHCYSNEQMSRILRRGFRSVEHVMDYEYELNEGSVIEPVFLVRGAYTTVQNEEAQTTIFGNEYVSPPIKEKEGEKGVHQRKTKVSKKLNYWAKALRLV